MCGISGYVLIDHTESSSETILQMTRACAHRGPDDEGLVLIWPEQSMVTSFTTPHSAAGIPSRHPIDLCRRLPHRIAFGHCRFSIVDVSPAGHQPFWSHDGEICATFNGEIYNYIELRQQLRELGHIFHTDCDTEVLVEAYREWGVACFARLNGFWALSIYDARKGAVLLARDRLGKAPLYIARAGDVVLWSSEIKGILSVSSIDMFPIRGQAVADFVQHGWRDVFHRTFYDGIVSFPNASYAWIETNGDYSPQKYWEFPQQRLRESDISCVDAINHFRHILADALCIRLRADVPIGFELSGGLDSSALVGLAAGTGANIRAFTVSFPGTSSDEECFASKVVDHFNGRIDYNVLCPPANDLLAQADSYIGLMEEPFHSPNLLSNQGVWRAMAQTGIRVSINGAGGDELLAGYALDYYAPYLRFLLRQGRIMEFAKELLLRKEKPTDRFYLDHMIRVYQLLPEELKLLSRAKSIPSSIDPFIRPMDIDAYTGPSWDIDQRLIDLMSDWRMNYWLRSGNTSAMGVPMEVRAPFLDYRLIDFSFTLPVSYLIRDGWLKWILRQAINESLPHDIVWRKVKGGFPFPYAEWLRASETRFFTMIGLLDCPYIDLRKLRQSYTELSNRSPLYLWRIMSLALWWKKCIQGEPLL